VIHFINKKMPGGLPKKTARALLDIEDKDYVPIIRDRKATTADTEAVFYFPGCGSERLFSQVGLATQAMLWHAGVQTVLPPGYLCCGYPQRGSGQFDKAEKIITDNRVLFHRVANTLNYLDIKTVVVSCGTCYDQLQGYKFEDIFPGCRIVDIHEYLLEKGITLPATRRRLPLPRPLPQPDEAAGADEDREGAGRPAGDQERALLRRKRHAGRDAARHQHADPLPQGKGAAQGRGRAARAGRAVAAQADVKILTSCPSCLQGLSRYRDDLQSGLLEADYIVVEMARKILGETGCPTTWPAPTHGGIERVLV
jgi:Fe-S oxidoreductase